MVQEVDSPDLSYYQLLGTDWFFWLDFLRPY